MADLIQKQRTINLMRKLGNTENPTMPEQQPSKIEQAQQSVNSAMDLNQPKGKSYSKSALSWLKGQFGGAPLGKKITAGLEGKNPNPEDEEENQ